MIDPYNARVRALFTHTAHAGTLDGAQPVAVDDQGVRLELSATVDMGAVASLRFRAWGCPHVIAAAEAACAEIEGCPVSDLEIFTVADLMQSLAVPAEKSARILVIEDAVRLLGAVLRKTS